LRSTEYSTSLFDRHLAQHEKLVHWVVHRQWLGRLPYLEAVQAGRIGLWHALQHYDPSRGLALSTYAVPAIRRTVWRAVDELEYRPDGSRSLGCWFEAPYSALDNRQAVEEIQRGVVSQALHELVQRLPGRLAYLIVARYGLDGGPPQSFVAIGRALGISKQRAHQLHAEALLWLSHPAHSLALRRLMERNSVADYRAYLARLRAWQRSQRRRR
jgi:RNA polymerase sigma factor (sigma-70 family)